MNPYIIPTILGLINVALAFIAWAINYERGEAVKKLSKERKEFEQGWAERTNALLDAQRQLADEMNRAESEAANAKKHNERANELRAELTESEKNNRENLHELDKLETAYVRSKQMVEKLNKQVDKLNKKLERIEQAKKHPKAADGKFKPKYEHKEQTPKTEAK